MRPGADPGPRRERALFAAAALALVLPLWAFEHLPFQDAPVHLANAEILRRWLAEPASLPAAYVLHEGPAPGILGHWLLALLLFVAPRGIALRLFLSAAALLLPCAVRALGRALRPGGERAGWLALPFVWSQLFQLGFLPFSLGLGLAFAFVALWARTRERPTAPHARGLALLGVALLGAVLPLAHLAAAAGALLLVGALELGRALTPSREPRARDRSPAALARALAPLAPAVLATAALALGSSYAQGSLEGARDFTAVARQVLALDVLVSHSDREKALALGTGALLLVLALDALVARAKARRLEPRGGGLEPTDALLGAALLLVALALASCDARSRAFYAPQRWHLLACLAGVVWLGAARRGRLPRRAGPAVAAGLAAGLLASDVSFLARAQAPVADALAVAAAVPPGATLVPLAFAPHGRDEAGRRLSIRTAPFLHLAALVAAERGAVDLTNDFQAVALRPELDPGPRLRAPHALEAVSRWLEEGGAPDIVLVLGATDEDRARPVFRVLAARSERVAVSPGGTTEVLKRRRSW